MIRAAEERARRRNSDPLHRTQMNIREAEGYCERTLVEDTGAARAARCEYNSDDYEHLITAWEVQDRARARDFLALAALYREAVEALEQVQATTLRLLMTTEAKRLRADVHAITDAVLAKARAALGERAK